ncbi:MAG: FMN-binding protein [Coriobacteriales bacterium]|jgi:uncharacterized protein with FMN-binding domain|nr:FMN-binding protein [Coriobacteriales bacterium]
MKRRIIPLLFLMTLIIMLLTGCVGGPKLYENGTYTGVGQGLGGEIVVTLTTENDVIIVDEVVGNMETEGVGGYEAIKDGTFADQIEAAQSIEIDGISGATYTTNGVKEATADALSQAKKD